MSESKESEDSTSTNKKTTDTENTATENKGVTTRRLTRTPQTILKGKILFLFMYMAKHNAYIVFPTTEQRK